MRPVIRRLLLISFAALVLAGCGAKERDALQVGDISISEEGLTDLVVALQGGSPDVEIPPVLPLQDYRRVGGTWLQLAAAVSYLEQNGVTMSQADRDAAKVQIEGSIAEQQIGPLSRQSEAYEALTINFWISTEPGDTGTEEARSATLDLLRDAEISSRIGELDLETFQIVPRG